MSDDWVGGSEPFSHEEWKAYMDSHLGKAVNDRLAALEEQVDSHHKTMFDAELGYSDHLNQLTERVERLEGVLSDNGLLGGPIADPEPEQDQSNYDSILIAARELLLRIADLWPSKDMFHGDYPHLAQAYETLKRAMEDV
jgi:hypothetical protein